MYFIVIYDKSIGKTVKIISFEDEDYKKAFEAMSSKTDDFKNYEDIEINLVTADNEVDLRKQWGRFFNH
jgi:hypothetical protein